MEEKAAFKTLFTVYIGKPEEERSEVALKNPTMADEPELLPPDFRFPWALSLTRSRRKSSAS